MLTATVSTCPSHKKQFATREEAEAFEAQNREKYNNPQQYAYACEDCTQYHLTSLPPGTQSLGRVNYEQIETTLPRTRGDNRERVRQLLEQGCDRKQIAEKLGMALSNVIYHHNIITGKRSTNPQASRVPVNLDTVSAQEAALEEELRAIRQKKNLLIEAARLKVQFINGGQHVEMRKEGEHFILPVEDAPELIEKLEDLLTASAVSTN